MRHDDIPAGLRLCRLANWNQVAADWQFFLDSSPDGCRVAEDEAGNVIGTVTTIAYGDAFAWIGMVLVDPEHRRGGIGTRLLKEALDVIGDTMTARLDATPAGRAVYAPLGFCDEYELQRMERQATVRRATNTTGAVRPMSDADFAEVVTYDRDIFGADRRTLLEMCRREAPDYALAIGRERLDGYVFGRHGHMFEHIGPLVARDEPAARLLAEASLSVRGDRPFIIDTPVRASWVEWLESKGFTHQRPFIRMRRGDRRAQERLDRMFAIAGPEFG